MADRSFRGGPRAVRGVLVLIACGLAVSVVQAIAIHREPTRFEDKLRARPGGVAAVTALPLSELSPADALRQGWERFAAEREAAWQVRLDTRSGLPTLAWGRGIPWIAGRGNELAADPEDGLPKLEALARKMIRDNPNLLGRFGDELVLDSAASGPLGAHGWQVTFRQVVDGVPVEGARYDFHVAHGNLVSFGATRWGAVTVATAPTLSVDEARAALAAYLGDTSGLVETSPPALSLVPLDPRGLDAAPWSGQRGRGLVHRLVWRFRMVEPGAPPTWVAEIDAHDGAVLALWDDTQYERIQGGVYPITNTNAPGDPSSAEQPFFPLPFVDYSEDGGATQLTGDFGLYQCNLIGSTIETTLTGQYVRVNDNCGPISEVGSCDGALDLDVSAGTNCVVPAGSSAGNTHASRSSYYHLNRIIQKAQFWLPSNTWLQQRLNDNVNIGSTCNAFWNGSVNFYRRGGGCGNTAELQAVVTHEWGHGMDQNDGGGYDNPSEAYADVVAILEARESCVGRGFFESGTCSGYGDTCLECTGIREMDWDKRQDHTPATPSGFEQSYCPSGGGPCGSAVHCASYVPSETIYDLAARDLPAAGMDADTAWQVAEPMFYLSRDGSGGDAFNCSLPDSDSCTANSWFHKLRVVDDDDGNLDNGTPNAAAIFAAFDRHDIACGNAGDASNQSSSACPTLAPPVLTATALTNAVELSWDSQPDAASYYVLRNEMGCDRSQLVVDQVAGTTLTDDGLGNEFELFYRVQPVGTNGSCVGPVSDCVAATPRAFAGKIRFRRAAFACDGMVELRLEDVNVGAASVNVEVFSDTETTRETVVLTETQPGSGLYLGEMPSDTGPPVPGDGVLSFVDGDLLTVEYTDADDGAGGSGIVRQHTASGDCSGPAILNVREENITLSSASILWETDELANTVLRWGETTPPDQVEGGADRSTTHRIDLSGLAECTVYYYEVESTDPALNTTLDDFGGAYYRFETLGDFGNGPQPCHAGQVDLGAGVYSCSDTIDFQVVDLDLNLDSAFADIVELTVTSSTETEPEVIVATETGPNTSIFTGSIATATGAPLPDGVLQVADGDVITVTYRDQDDGTGLPALSFDTSLADCSGPAISGLVVDTITNARATIRWNTDENADTLVEWGPTPALGQAVSSGALTLTHAVAINQFDSCGTFYFRVTSTDAEGNTTVADAGGQPFAFQTFQIPGLYHLDDFENGGADWTLQGEWEVGPPQGLGGSTGVDDPAAAYNNGAILGHDLSGQGAFPGDYEPASNEIARSPTLDGSGWTNTTLIYHRQLNTGNGDNASLWLHTDGVSRPLFLTLGDPVSESDYQVVNVDISTFADGASTVYLEFRQTADVSGNHSGWNVDDVILKDGTLPDFGACLDCGVAPAFAGAVAAADNNACGADGVPGHGDAAAAWGSGGSGTYAVYRDTAPGFEPSGLNLVASGVAGTSYNDLTAPTDQDLWYVVRAENDDNCGVGPNNGGLTDDNTIYVPVSESTSQPLPGEVVLRADLVNKAHVRVSWDAVASAASYRVLRSEMPQRETFAQLDEVGALVFEDLNQGGNASSFFYLVTAVNACGDEGP